MSVSVCPSPRDSPGRQLVRQPKEEDLSLSRIGADGPPRVGRTEVAECATRREKGLHSQEWLEATTTGGRALLTKSSRRSYLSASLSPCSALAVSSTFHPTSACSCYYCTLLPSAPAPVAPSVDSSTPTQSSHTCGRAHARFPLAASPPDNSSLSLPSFYHALVRVKVLPREKNREGTFGTGKDARGIAMRLDKS